MHNINYAYLGNTFYTNHDYNNTDNRKLFMYIICIYIHPKTEERKEKDNIQAV